VAAASINPWIDLPAVLAAILIAVLARIEAILRTTVALRKKRRTRSRQHQKRQDNPVHVSHSNLNSKKVIPSSPQVNSLFSALVRLTQPPREE
jgi:hypothetical protein